MWIASAVVTHSKGPAYGALIEPKITFSSPLNYLELDD